MNSFKYNDGNLNKYKSNNKLKQKMIHRFNDKLFSILDNIIKEDYKIADVGCGEGFITEQIAKRYKNAEIEGIEYTEEALKIAKDRNSEPTPKS